MLNRLATIQFNLNRFIYVSLDIIQVRYALPTVRRLMHKINLPQLNFEINTHFDFIWKPVESKQDS